MKKNFALGVLLSAVALFGFSLLQVSAQIRSRSEVFTDIHEYLTTINEEVFKAHTEWPNDMKASMYRVIQELTVFKVQAAGDVSRMDQPSFLLHRK